MNALLQSLEGIERRFVDLRFQWRGALPPDPNIVIVAIDKPILSEDELPKAAFAKSPALQAMTEGYQESWRHIVWAEAIERLMESGAKVVVFDVVFQRKAMEALRIQRILKTGEGSRLSAEDTERILEAARADSAKFRAMVEKYASRLVLGVSYEPDGNSVRLIIPHPTLAPEDFENLFGNVLIAFDSADDQTLRNSRHRWVNDDLLLDLQGMDAMTVRKFNETGAPDSIANPIRFSGPRNTYPHIPLSAIFVDEWLAPHGGASVFKDKIVYVGATYELAHDDKNTPFGTMPGVEVHANIAADLLSGSRLKELPFHFAFWIALAMVIVPTAIVLLIRNAFGQIVGILTFVGLYIGVCHLAFSYWDRIFPMMVSVFGPAACGGLGIVYSFFLEQRERRHVREKFGQFVNKRIAEKILQHSEEFDHARTGERRPVVVLFSDIRSFTTWSEQATPEHLVGQLNEYFQRMVPLVEDSEGNAQKFIGDAILAAWGDTHTNGANEDARRAVFAALQMRTALRELNAGWNNRPDRIVISIGIGINRGEVVTGEVGHPERREFTVLGDGVNFAARLESATKQFHTDCLVGESVEELTRDHFIFREVGFLRVKGKTKPVHIFTPISEKSTPAPEWLVDYHRALALHRTRDFEKAAALLTDVKTRAGGDDFLCDWYLDLGRRYLHESPREDWDGSETLTEK